MAENLDLMIPEPAEIPAYAVDKTAAAAAWGDLMAGMPAGAPPRLKIAGKQFTMVDSTGVETPFPMGKMFTGPDDNLYLQALVLAGRPKLQKSWYAQAYNPNAEEASAPDCYSNDGEKPDSTAPAPQADTCANCPKNAFGSGVDQNGLATAGKACQDIKIMAIFIPHYGIFSFKIPPASFKNWAALGKQLMSAGLVPGHVKYLIGFDPAQTYPVLVFKYGGVVPEALLPELMAKAESAECQDILNNRISNNSAAKAPAAPAEPAATQTETAADLGLGEADAGNDLGLGGDEEEEELAEDTVDASGTAHDPRYHASTKTRVVGGFWKLKPGLSEADKATAMAMRTGGAATEPAAQTQDGGGAAPTGGTPSDDEMRDALGLG